MKYNNLEGEIELFISFFFININLILFLSFQLESFNIFVTIILKNNNDKLNWHIFLEIIIETSISNSNNNERKRGKFFVERIN
jgi:hypothetical protein